MTKISIQDMIHELKRMLKPIVRTGAEVRRRTEVFEAAIQFLQAYDDTMRIRVRLRNFYDREDSIDMWLTLPSPQFGGKSALDLIADGKTAKVEAALQQLEDGTHV